MPNTAVRPQDRNALAIGVSVRLRACPGPLRPYGGLEGALLRLYDRTDQPRGAEEAEFGAVRFDNGTEFGVIVPDIPVAYMEAVPEPKRRGVLNLHHPKDTRSEKKRQAAIVKMLKAEGYKVMVTGTPLKIVRCEECGHVQWPKGGNSNEPGIGDLLVTHPARWPLGTWVMLECKTDTGEVRPEQQALADAGLSWIVRNEAETREAVKEFEDRLGGVAAAGLARGHD